MYTHVDSGNMILLGQGYSGEGAFDPATGELEAPVETVKQESEDVYKVLADLLSAIKVSSHARGRGDSDGLNQSLARLELVENRAEALLDEKGIGYADPYRN